MKPLVNKVALVAGATRGAGRGMARMLGEAGATVCCAGRSSRQQPNINGHHYGGRPETIEETVHALLETRHSEIGRIAAVLRDQLFVSPPQPTFTSGGKCFVRGQCVEARSREAVHRSRTAESTGGFPRRAGSILVAGVEYRRAIGCR